MPRWNPALWVSLKPFGIGEKRPNNYKEIWKAFKDTKGKRRFAWKILSDGVCDGCALGTTGMHDWTIDGVHLCNIRLRLLPMNVMDPLPDGYLDDVEPLRYRRSKELREAGRLSRPMVRRAGEAGFTPIGWDQAYDLIAERIVQTSPDRLAFYLTSRGMPNESYYAAAKAVRAMGTNSIDNAARVCHSPSTVALKQMTGVAATTCSYTDWMHADLIVFIGSNMANNQPVAMKYLYYARGKGTKVVCVNSYKEPGMDRYWVPSNAESAIFGTKMTDRWFLVRNGGDIGFLNGVLKHCVERGWVDESFIERHTTGFQAVAGALAAQTWEELEAASGTTRDQMLELALMLSKAPKAVLVWSMGVTQHACGEDNVRAVVNLGLARGYVGRQGCGLMPIRGHSGVQGGAEMGAYATAFPAGICVDEAGAAQMSELWGFDVPSRPGLTAPEMLDAAHRGRLDVLFSAGGNFLEVMPDPDWVQEALGRIRLRVHADIVVTNQMLVDPADTVVLLPAATRYEIPGGVTETSTERRVIFSPEIPGPRPGDVRGEWEVLGEIAARVRPALRDKVAFASTAAVRSEIERVVPFYDGIAKLKAKGDQFQYGGAHLCEGGRFPTSDGRARFAVVVPPADDVEPGVFRLTTRRGKQFNSMVHEQRDPLNQAMRSDVLMHASDAGRLGLAAGDPIKLTSPSGSYRGKVKLAEVAPGSLQAHWPECAPLLGHERRSPQAGVPDYNAHVRVERV